MWDIKQAAEEMILELVPNLRQYCKGAMCPKDISYTTMKRMLDLMFILVQHTPLLKESF